MTYKKAFISTLSCILTAYQCTSITGSQLFLCTFNTHFVNIDLKCSDSSRINIVNAQSFTSNKTFMCKNSEQALLKEVDVHNLTYNMWHEILTKCVDERECSLHIFADRYPDHISNGIAIEYNCLPDDAFIHFCQQHSYSKTVENSVQLVYKRDGGFAKSCKCNVDTSGHTIILLSVFPTDSMDLEVSDRGNTKYFKDRVYINNGGQIQTDDRKNFFGFVLKDTVKTNTVVPFLRLNFSVLVKPGNISVHCAQQEMIENQLGSKSTPEIGTSSPQSSTSTPKSSTSTPKSTTSTPKSSTSTPDISTSSPQSSTSTPKSSTSTPKSRTSTPIRPSTHERRTYTTTPKSITSTQESSSSTSESPTLQVTSLSEYALTATISAISTTLLIFIFGLIIYKCILKRKQGTNLNKKEELQTSAKKFTRNMKASVSVNCTDSHSYDEIGSISDYRHYVMPDDVTQSFKMEICLENDNKGYPNEDFIAKRKQKTLPKIKNENKVDSKIYNSVGDEYNIAKGKINEKATDSVHLRSQFTREHSSPDTNVKGQDREKTNKGLQSASGDDKNLGNENRKISNEHYDPSGYLDLNITEKTTHQTLQKWMKEIYEVERKARQEIKKEDSEKTQPVGQRTVLILKKNQAPEHKGSLYSYADDHRIAFSDEETLFK